MAAPLILGGAIVALLALASGASKTRIEAEPPPDTRPRWPTPPLTSWRKISSRFGWRTHPVSHEQVHHNGIDVPAPEGTAVLAPEAGRVIRIDVAGVGAGASRGNAVWLRAASGKLWGFLHLSAVRVGVGELVGEGQVLGLVGSTGQSTGNHLHLQVYASTGELVDPVAEFAPGTFA